MFEDVQCFKCDVITKILPALKLFNTNSVGSKAHLTRNPKIPAWIFCCFVQLEINMDLFFVYLLGCFWNRIEHCTSSKTIVKLSQQYFMHLNRKYFMHLNVFNWLSGEFKWCKMPVQIPLETTNFSLISAVLDLYGSSIVFMCCWSCFLFEQASCKLFQSRWRCLPPCYLIELGLRLHNSILFCTICAESILRDLYWIKFLQTCRINSARFILIKFLQTCRIDCRSHSVLESSSGIWKTILIFNLILQINNEKFVFLSRIQDQILIILTLQRTIKYSLLLKHDR